MFTLKHQDGDLIYQLQKGGFAFAEEKLFVSLESQAVGSDIFPETYLLALVYPWQDSKQCTASFHVDSHIDYDFVPNLFVYTSFHANEAQGEFVVERIKEKQIKISFSVLSDDVHYYNEQAKPNLCKGEAIVFEKEQKDLWIPC